MNANVEGQRAKPMDRETVNPVNSQLTTPADSSLGRIAALDGWRGIAIGLVLIDHIQDSQLNHYLKPWTQTGFHGVLIFFVLSGYLITSNLLRRSINLKQFYVRRFFRLMPAAWTYLALLLLIDYYTHAHLTYRGDVLACLFFYRNFYPQPNGNIDGHFWSLSIEEQFYLFWPAILLLAGPRRGRWIAAGGAVACSGYRWLFWSCYSTGNASLHTQFHVDALLAGCLMALLFDDPQIRQKAIHWSKIWAAPALVALIICIARVNAISLLVESIAMCVLLAASVFHSGSIFVRAILFKPLVFLGVISYSIYIWQEFFMGFRNWFAYCMILPVAYGSYALIERPITRLGHRLTVPTKRNLNLLEKH